MSMKVITTLGDQTVLIIHHLEAKIHKRGNRGTLAMIVIEALTILSFPEREVSR